MWHKLEVASVFLIRCIRISFDTSLLCLGFSEYVLNFRQDTVALLCAWLLLSFYVSDCRWLKVSVPYVPLRTVYKADIMATQGASGESGSRAGSTGFIGPASVHVSTHNEENMTVNLSCDLVNNDRAIRAEDCGTKSLLAVYCMCDLIYLKKICRKDTNSLLSLRIIFFDNWFTKRIISRWIHYRNNHC